MEKRQARKNNVSNDDVKSQLQELICKFAISEAFVTASGRYRYASSWSLLSPRSEHGRLECSANLKGKGVDELSVVNATLKMDDGTARLYVSQTADPSLYETPYDRHFLEVFQEAYEFHDHVLCVRALTQRLNEPIVQPTPKMI